jgi:hypothetical protein
MANIALSVVSVAIGISAVEYQSKFLSAMRVRRNFLVRADTEQCDPDIAILFEPRFLDAPSGAFPVKIRQIGIEVIAQRGRNQLLHKVRYSNCTIVSVLQCSTNHTSTSRGSEWISNHTVASLKADFRLESILTNSTYHL